jgi:hypothetical protein
MVYHGIGLPARIVRDLDFRLARGGFATVVEATGMASGDRL